MADSSNMVERSSTGDITTASASLRGVVLTAGSDAASVVVRSGGSGGTVILTLKAATATSEPTGYIPDVLCSGGIHVTLTGTGPTVAVVYA